jgi:transposase
LVKAYEEGKLGDVGKAQKPLTEVEMELARTKKELVEVKMERDILKKAAAYFAKESLHGTRR